MKTINMRTDPYAFLAQKYELFNMILRGGSLAYDVPGHPVKYKVIDKSLKPQDLGFITAVKKHVQREGRTFDVDRHQIKYSLVNERLKTGVMEGEFVEVDINSAYWQIARRLEIISPALFEKGNQVPKDVRLIALGALATLEEVFEVTQHGENERLISSIREETYSNFFKICDTLSKLVMQPVYKQFADNIVMFWVDAFIINRDIETALSQEVKIFDLDIKTKPIDKIEVTDTKIFCHMPGRPKPKPFPRHSRRAVLMKDFRRRIQYRKFMQENL